MKIYMQVVHAVMESGGEKFLFSSFATQPAMNDMIY